MLSAKPWKPEAVIRLLASVFLCIYAGSLAISLFHYARASVRVGRGFIFLAVAAVGSLLLTLVLVRRPWRLERLMTRLVALLVCFYTAMLLGAWAQKLAGPPGNSTAHMLMSTLSFQGATLILIGWLLREHQVSWAEGFGFSNDWRRALILGLLLACIFLPIGWGLQLVSARALEWTGSKLAAYFPRLQLQPEEQQAIRILRDAPSWAHRLALGAVTILLAPAAEEMLFRGVLYPAIKDRGLPGFALWGTSILFAAVHVNAATFVPLLVLALVLTMLYEKTDNLIAPISAHALFNAINFAKLYWLEKQMT